MSDSALEAALSEIHIISQVIGNVSGTIDRISMEFRILSEKNQDPDANPDSLIEGIEKLIGEIQDLPDYIETISQRLSGIDIRLHEVLEDIEVKLQAEGVSADGAGRIMGRADSVFSRYEQLNRQFDELMDNITGLMAEIAEI